jgi:hypothetical protein
MPTRNYNGRRQVGTKLFLKVNNDGSSTERRFSGPNAQHAAARHRQELGVDQCSALDFIIRTEFQDSKILMAYANKELADTTWLKQQPYYEKRCGKR